MVAAVCVRAFKLVEQRGTARPQGGTIEGAQAVRALLSRSTAHTQGIQTMKALIWQGKKDIRYESVPDPRIEHPRDAVIKVSTCAICGSDLHLFDGFMPGMKSGDVMGHEFMGEVVEVGSENSALRIGERVVVPFTIICGECDQCKRGNFSVCERSNRNKDDAEKLFGHTTAGLFGYTHLTGGYSGGQAEYVRVPFADKTHVKIPEGLSDEQVLFLGDIFPTGWQAAVQCEIEPTDTVAIWGAGPVGQMAVRSALLLGAKQVVVIDRVPERLAMARAAGAISIDFKEESVLDRLKDLTQGKGPEKCIDAVGMESHATRSFDALYDRAKQAVMLETDRPHVLREMIYVCRPAGTLSVPGVYGGLIDKIPFGAAMNKGLTWRMGQTHVNRWTDDLLRRIQEGQIDPSFIITHRVSLADGPEMYKTFRDKEDGCIKVVLKP
ncbi:glutathione-dependent formaldehyde dehydrogenase [Caballeronia novacaledonica]|uniref:Glutathione-dependent formaldehyde dehydrogenase n=2 Tax=Caballeronia novacaledonica TaxID=1544861 RepID=A0AA37IFG8_9BURK|nr:glutathione-dependent formaldehyde dehydrogenase [Caballeronia novacaledonica]